MGYEAFAGRAVIDQEIDRAVQSRVDLLCQASEHIIHAGGKRIRPRLVMLAYQAAGGETLTATLPVAVAVELIHTASLVHDDINDRSDLRRGRETVNARWGSAAALLAGDFLFGKVMKVIADLDPRIIEVLADTCVHIVEGETRQMLTLGDLDMNEETYLEIVSQKTASLFSASAQSGGILASASDRAIEALGEFGLNLGISFQIQDDTLDCVGHREELGKPVAIDLAQQKMSLMTVVGLQRSEELRELWACQDTAGITRLLHDTGSVEYAMSRARDYSQRAKDALSILPPSEARAELCAWADFAVNRSL
jgi:geranylgeranyl pyrophosphate synthase